MRIPAWTLFVLLAAAPVAAQPAAMAPGDAVEAQISSSAEAIPDGRPGASYRLRLPVGTAVEVRLTAQAFDTFLLLIAEDGTTLENDDYDFSLSESRVLVEADGPREWVIYVTSYGGSGEGAFLLEVGEPGSFPAESERLTSSAEADESDEALAASAEAPLLHRAYALMRLERRGEMLALLQHELPRLAGSAAADDPNLIEAERLLARELASGGDSTGARSVLESRLQRQERELGTDHPALADTWELLAEFAADQESKRVAREHALVVLEAADGPDHISVGRALRRLAEALPSDDHAGRRALLERALPILRDHEESEPGEETWTLSDLAFATEALGDVPAARSYLEQVIGAHEQYRPDSPSLAAALTDYARHLRRHGGGGAAVPLLRRAVQIFEGVQAATAPDDWTARRARDDLLGGLDLLGWALLAEAEYAQAADVLGRALRMRDDVADTAADESLRQALRDNLFQLSVALELGGMREEADAVHDRAGALPPLNDWEAVDGRYVAQRMRADGLEAAAAVLWARIGGREAVVDLGDFTDDELQPGRLLTDGPRREAALAALERLEQEEYRLRQDGRYGEALRAGARALALARATTAPGEDALYRQLGNVAGLHAIRGDYRSARPLYEEALALAQANFAPDAVGIAWALRDLADALSALGDHEAALRHYENALTIEEDDAYRRGVARSLTALGQYGAAHEQYQALLRQARAEHGAGTFEESVALNNLGMFLLGIGRAADAIEPLQQALEVVESLYSFDPGRIVQGSSIMGRGPSAIATVGHNLAGAYVEAGRLPEARPLYDQALRIYEAVNGGNHPDVGRVLGLQGRLLHRLSDLPAAVAAYERAIAIAELSYGADHPEVAGYLNGLADVLQDRGDTRGARAAALRAIHIYDDHAAAVLPALAPAEQRAFVADALTGLTTRMLSGTAPLSVAESYAMVGGWKGILLEGLRRQAAVSRLADHPRFGDDVAALNALRSEIAWHTSLAGEMPAARWRAIADSLTADKERLERALAAALPAGALQDPWRTPDNDALGGRLPRGAALLDVYRHELLDGDSDGTFRYTAVLTAAGAAPVLVPIGAADAVEQAIAAWRDAVVRGQDAAAETQALVDAVWGPVAAALPAAVQRLWISPDAQLARVPWSLLAAAGGSDAILVSEVASPRALLAALHTGRDYAAEPGSVLLVGGVDFDAGVAGDSAGARWADLPGTRAEVDSISALAVSAEQPHRVLTGAEPTPAVVAAALAESRYAHLSTHGFFYRASEAEYRAGESRSVIVGRAAGGRPPSRNPLAESGLALAGANAAAAGNLTAEELLSIDLSGLELLVLAACDTGLGTEITGQGVMGLRASVQAAGAHGLLMSLWKVPDASTALLMQHFYDGLWTKGLSPAEALRDAQVAVRADDRYAAPIHWAAWVLSGGP